MISVLHLLTIGNILQQTTFTHTLLITLEHYVSDLLTAYQVFKKMTSPKPETIRVSL
jgi:hypothetical protein